MFFFSTICLLLLFLFCTFCTFMFKPVLFYGFIYAEYCRKCVSVWFELDRVLYSMPVSEGFLSRCLDVQETVWRQSENQKATCR